MKQGIKYTITILAGLTLGTGGAWALAGRGLGKADIVNGSWTTSLGYGTKSTDPFTRAGVARRGLLALPATETVYWQAAVDSDGKALDGSCRYAMTGAALDARWWSVTVYDTAGYLMPNALNAWSFNGAAISEAEKGGWRVEIGPKQPASGHWLPTTAGKPFHLTLRMYNPGKGFIAAPSKSALPALKKEGCA